MMIGEWDAVNSLRSGLFTVAMKASESPAVSNRIQSMNRRLAMQKNNNNRTMAN